MGLEFIEREELIVRLLGLESGIDGDLRLVGQLLEKIGRAKKELDMIKEELTERDV